jgi:hypothetical protein
VASMKLATSAIDRHMSWSRTDIAGAFFRQVVS